MASDKQVNSHDDLQYGSAANGIHVGSGYDCEIKRESGTTALVNVISLPDGTDWLMAIDIESQTDLQRMAIDIACCPDFGNNDYVARFDDGWPELARRWNAIEVHS